MPSGAEMTDARVTAFRACPYRPIPTPHLRWTFRSPAWYRSASLFSGQSGDAMYSVFTLIPLLLSIRYELMNRSLHGSKIR